MAIEPCKAIATRIPAFNSLTTAVEPQEASVLTSINYALFGEYDMCSCLQFWEQFILEGRFAILAIWRVYTSFVRSVMGPRKRVLGEQNGSDLNTYLVT